MLGLRWARALVAATCALAALGVAAAQEMSAADRDALLAGAKRFATAQRERDFDALLAVMQPRVISILGGRDAARRALAASADRARKAGVTVTDYQFVATSQPYAADPEIVVFITTRIEQRRQGQRLGVRSYLVASRPKAGGAWTYVDGAGIGDRQALERLFPNLPPVVLVPSKSQTVLKP